MGIYQGNDYRNYLAHKDHKYIDRIKTSYGWRYIYDLKQKFDARGDRKKAQEVEKQYNPAYGGTNHPKYAQQVQNRNQSMMTGNRKALPSTYDNKWEGGIRKGEKSFANINAPKKSLSDKIGEKTFGKIFSAIDANNARKQKQETARRVQEHVDKSNAELAKKEVQKNMNPLAAGSTRIGKIAGNDRSDDRLEIRSEKKLNQQGTGTNNYQGQKSKANMAQNNKDAIKVGRRAGRKADIKEYDIGKKIDEFGENFVRDARRKVEDKWNEVTNTKRRSDDRSKDNGKTFQDVINEAKNNKKDDRHKITSNIVKNFIKRNPDYQSSAIYQVLKGIPDDRLKKIKNNELKKLLDKSRR